MSFEWRQYHTLAQDLLDCGHGYTCTSEALLRAASSRAYYAVYCTARNRLRKESGDYSLFSSPSSHMDVRMNYAHSLSIDKQVIAKNLERLQRRRIDADYNDVLSTSTRDSEATLEIARQTLELIERAA